MSREFDGTEVTEHGGVDLRDSTTRATRTHRGVRHGDQADGVHGDLGGMNQGDSGTGRHQSVSRAEGTPGLYGRRVADRSGCTGCSAAIPSGTGASARRVMPDDSPKTARVKQANLIRKEPDIVFVDPLGHFLLHVMPARHGFERIDTLAANDDR